MKNTIETVGFIGFGPMGQFMAQEMFPDCEIVAHDPSGVTATFNDVSMVDATTAARQDAVVMAVPVPAFRDAVYDHVIDVLPENLESTDSLIIDIGSVKQVTQSWFDILDPSLPQRLSCHPLFGPQTAREGVAGHQLVVTEAIGDKAEEQVQRWQQLGIEIVRMTAKEHDGAMLPHALSAIVGRLVSSLGFDAQPAIQTPSMRPLLELGALDRAHSQELFESIVQCNPGVGRMLATMQSNLTELQRVQADSRTLYYFTREQELRGVNGH